MLDDTPVFQKCQALFIIFFNKRKTMEKPLPKLLFSIAFFFYFILYKIALIASETFDTPTNSIPFIFVLSFSQTLG